jgi:hypothetical protein
MGKSQLLAGVRPRNTSIAIRFNLISGTNILWTSLQLGHSSPHQTLTRYSAWIQQSDKASETNKLDAFVNQSRGEVGEKKVG